MESPQWPDMIILSHGDQSSDHYHLNNVEHLVQQILLGTAGPVYIPLTLCTCMTSKMRISVALRPLRNQWGEISSTLLLCMEPGHEHMPCSVTMQIIVLVRGKG